MKYLVAAILALVALEAFVRKNWAAIEEAVYGSFNGV